MASVCFDGIGMFEGKNIKVLTCNVIFICHFHVLGPGLRTCSHKKHQMYDITSIN